MMRKTARVYIQAAKELQATEEKLSKEIARLYDKESENLGDVWDDLSYMRDAVRKAREDMEHRIADAEDLIKAY